MHGQLSRVSYLLLADSQEFHFLSLPKPPEQVGRGISLWISLTLCAKSNLKCYSWQLSSVGGFHSQMKTWEQRNPSYLCVRCRPVKPLQRYLFSLWKPLWLDWIMQERLSGLHTDQEVCCFLYSVTKQEKSSRRKAWLKALDTSLCACCRFRPSHKSHNFIMVLMYSEDQQ